MSRPDPVFTEPWHAQVFALTVRLNETGQLPWPIWAAAFAETLKKNGLTKELDGGDDYFNAWLETLEKMLITKGMAQQSDVAGLMQAWREAYLRTPHGRPVKLAD